MTGVDLIYVLALLFFVHFLADYPLQSAFMAKAKNSTTPVPGIPWPFVLIAHSGIHAGFVLLVTGHIAFAIAELIIHSIIDYCKCNDVYGFGEDQTLHFITKIIYALVMSYFVMTPYWFQFLS